MKRNPVRVSSTTTVANAAGLTLASVVTGALLQDAPLPRHLTFIVLLALVITATVLVLLMPSPESSNSGSWKLQRISVPANVRRLYIVAAIPVSVVFCVGALLLSLGASMVRELLHTNNAFVAGITLSVLTVSLAATGLLLRNLRPHTSIVSGGLVAAVSLGLLQWEWRSPVASDCFWSPGRFRGVVRALELLRWSATDQPCRTGRSPVRTPRRAVIWRPTPARASSPCSPDCSPQHTVCTPPSTCSVPILAAAALASAALGWHDARSRAATT